MSDTNGLSREQVEALAEQLCRLGNPSQTWGWSNAHNDVRNIFRRQAQALAPTVAAMLAEARAEVMRDVDALVDRWDAEAERRGRDVDTVYTDGVVSMLRTTLARHMPSAVQEGGTERPGAPGDSGGPSEADRPSDGRTGPHPVPEPCSACGWQYDEATLDAARRGQVRLDFNPTHYCHPNPTCGEALGDMRCQLKRGHDGQHEDWSGA